MNKNVVILCFKQKKQLVANEVLKKKFSIMPGDCLQKYLQTLTRGPNAFIWKKTPKKHIQKILRTGQVRQTQTKTQDK